jgi:hypothetical protein
MTRRFEDTAADFVPAVERVFGVQPPALEDWIDMVEVNDDIEAAQHAAKERLARG